MDNKYITLMSVEERKEFRALMLRRNYNTDTELTAIELGRYDALLTLRAEEDYANFWRDNNFSKAEAIRYLKAKVERDCFP